MKWLILTLLAIVLIPIVMGVCCERNRDCIISETCQDAACGNCSITIYNRTGIVEIPLSNMELVTYYTYIFNISKNLTKFGIYPYTINCSNNKVCKGECRVEIKQECGEEGKDNMILGISLFLLLFNIGLFVTPVIVKQFTKNPVSNYVIRRLMVMAGILVLWFNSLIFRQMASDYGLGIDNYLIAYWWFFTLGVFIIIFVMCYVMVLGALDLAKQAQLRRRMGYDEKEY